MSDPIEAIRRLHAMGARRVEVKPDGAVIAEFGDDEREAAGDFLFSCAREQSNFWPTE